MSSISMRMPFVLPLEELLVEQLLLLSLPLSLPLLLVSLSLDPPVVSADSLAAESLDPRFPQLRQFPDHTPPSVSAYLMQKEI